MYLWIYAVACVLCLELTYGKTINVPSTGSCRSYSIDEYNPLNINYNNGIFHSTCKISIFGGTVGKKICITTRSAVQGNCDCGDYCGINGRSTIKVKYFEGSFATFPEKTYGCDESRFVSNDEWCTSFSKASITLEGDHASSTYLSLRVELKDDGFSNYDSDVHTAVTGAVTLVGIMVGAIVLVIIVIIVVTCYCCNRRRSTGGTVYRSPQAQQTITAAPPPAPTYPAGQYPVQAQPGGYPTQPMQLAYQAQGYQPPPTGYQPPPTGYQPTPAGYQPQPAYPASSAQGAAGYQPSEKPMPSAPPQESKMDQPPPYPGF